MAQRQDGAPGEAPHDPAASMLGMALGMMLMCVGMVVAISVASAVGGPVAWTVAVLAIIGLALAHTKLMRHGGH